MAGLTPYGDAGSKALSRLLALLSTVDAELTKGAEQAGAAADAIETNVARMEKAAQAQARGSRVGTSGSGTTTTEENAAAEKRITASMEEQVGLQQKLLQLREANLAALKQTVATLRSVTLAESPLLAGATGIRGAAIGAGLGTPASYGYPGRSFAPPPLALPPGTPQAALPPGRQYLGLPPPGGTVGGSRFNPRGPAGLLPASESELVGGSMYSAPGFTMGAKDAATGTSNFATAQGTLNARLAENASRIGVSTQDLRSYGALTTQYFASLNRGSGTLKELGFQVTSTIQKFGGWLGAGAAVYGAVGAVGALAKGAIDSSSGVTQLARVVDNVHNNADQTSKSFRDLATHFNLPISDVSDAAFGMGKAFHQLGPDLTATKAALYAVKIGEIDAATATRYLVSIVNGFHLSAGQMPGLFDQVVVAQKRYAVQLPDLLAGTAKAAGSFKQQGGDITHLIGLITLLAHVTGQSGTVIGTALQRAPHFIAQQTNSATLQSFGIDPKQSIVDVLDQAAKAAQGKSKEVQRQLGEAIFGPQYSSRFGGAFFQNQKLYNQILGDVSPEASRGAAERQLQITLGKTSEALKAIVTQLEVMGSELASTGILDPLGGMVRLLDQALMTVNSLLEVFNALPDPIKKTVTYLLDAAAVIKTLRFFNFGRQYPADSLRATLFTRPNQLRTEARSAITTQQEALAGRAGSLAGQETSALVVEERTRRELETAQRIPGALVPPAQGEEASGAYKAAQSAEAKHTAAVERLSGIQTDYSIVLEQQIAAAKALEAAMGAHTEAEVKAALAEHGIALEGIPRLGGGVPNVAEAERLRNARLGTAGPLGTPVVYGRGAQPIGGGGGESFTTTAEGVTQSDAAVAEQVSQRAKLAQMLGVSGGTIASGAGKLVASTKRFAGVNWSRIGTGIRGGVDSFLGALGPLDYAIVGLLVLPPVLDALESKLNETSQGLAAARKQGIPHTADALKKQVAALAAGTHPYASRDANRVQIGGLTIGNPIDEIQGAITQLGGGDQNVAASQARIRRIMSGRSKVLYTLTSTDKAIASSFVLPSDLQNALQLDIQEFKKGKLSNDEFAQKTAALVKTARESKLPQAKVAQLVTAIHLAGINAEGSAASFFQLESTAGATLGGLITTYGQIVAGGLGTGKDRATLVRDSFAQITRGLQVKGNTAAAQKLRTDAASALDTVVSSLQSAGQTNLQTDLALAKGQQERDAAYGKYIKTLDPGQINAVANRQKSALQGQLQDTQKKIGALKDAISQIQKQSGPTGALEKALGPIAGALGIDIPSGGVPPAIKKQLDNAKKHEDAIKKALAGINKVQHLEDDRIKALKKAQQDAQYQEDQAIFEAQTAYQASQLDAGLPQIEFQIKRIGQEITTAIQHYGRDSTQVLQLLQQQQDLRNQAVQEQAAQIQSNSALAAAGINSTVDPVAAARAAITGQQQLLAFEKAHPRVYKPSDITQLEADIKQAQTQLAETIYEQATALRDSAYAVQEAQANLAGNTVKAAQIAVNQAHYDLSRARTPKEQQDANTALLNARQQKRQAIFDNEIGDIQFQAQIGQLTLAQQIQAYQHLLDTLKLTKQMRQQLKEEIYGLKQQEFDLDVGNIKLPTIYDIRRAIAGGVTHQTNVNIQNNVKVDAKGNSNANDVAQKVGNTLGGVNRSAMKAAGLI